MNPFSDVSWFLQDYPACIWYRPLLSFELFVQERPGQFGPCPLRTPCARFQM